jgi:type IX secretion system PorP/SprF family membrane protein
MPDSACSKKEIILLVLLIFGLFDTSKAQDVYFSQFYLNPVYMNPAYSGTMKVPRAGVQYRDQWPGLEKAYTTYFASFDTYLPKISSGIGLLLFNDVQGNGLYTETSFKFSYSKEIQINKDWTMYGSISAGAQMNSLNFNRLIFSDGLDYDFGQTIPTSEAPPDNNNHIFPDLGTGILIYNGQYFFGAAVDHLNQPNQAVYSNYPNKILLKYTAHFEVNLPFFLAGHWRKFCKLNPNVIIQSQGTEHNVTYGIYANRKGFSLGVWNRLTTARSSDLIAMVGFISKQFKTAITYDTNLNGQGLRSHGAIELSIGFLFKDPGKKSIFPFYEIPGEWDIR